MNRCLIGDCRDVMRELIAEGVKVNICVTSPPYWGLRDYGTAQWEGGSGEECDHQISSLRSSKTTLINSKDYIENTGIPYRDACGKCGAKRIDRQLGLEPTIDEYVANLVEVFGLVRELLADDGTLFLNLGDSYAGSGMTGGINSINGGDRKQAIMFNSHRRDSVPGLKTKDLCGIPWRVAFALQADGWYLRQDIIWHKPNPMPESITDRCTKAHEYVFLLSKRERYFFDQEAVREPHQDKLGIERFTGKRGISRDDFEGINQGHHGTVWKRAHNDYNPNGRNRRSVWTIPSEPYPESHFATFPQALVEPCVMAGTSGKGHCPQCGKGWGRIVEREFIAQQDVSEIRGVRGALQQKSMDASNGWNGFPRGNTKTKTTGWQPTCACGLDPTPGVVFDPFFGSGTVGQVAERLGRHWIGIELNPAYGELAKQRTAQMGLQLSAS